MAKKVHPVPMASTERDALVALIPSTGGDSWNDLVNNWTKAADLSTWRGVTADKDGLVVELRLCGETLQGPIPEALGDLTNLKKLDFSENELTGLIPDALSALTKLTSLDIGGNQLKGPIPEVLQALTDLTQLNLSDNQLAGRIPEALGALTNLMELCLSYNQHSGPIPDVLGTLTNLTELSLSNNNFTGPIPEALGALDNLTELDLSYNQLTGPIPEAMGRLTNLEQLELSNNQLDGTVPLGVWKLPRIEEVNLCGNLLTHFTDPAKETTPTRVVLACMVRLERLEEENFIKNVGLVTKENPWEFPPAAVVANGRESIRKYYETWEQCGFSLEEIHALKVVLVGAYGAGKTSLARSIMMGRGDRTPEEDENSRTTVGVDLHSHQLRNGTECKIYDVAGQITYYGLHQFFLTERGVYVIVWNATKFEGLSGADLDQAIEDNILEWVYLLHMRIPLCTVMLVASHDDMLRGCPNEKKRLLVTVEERFLKLHEEWKSLRDDQSAYVDTRLTILPGIYPVGCSLASVSESHTARDGLRAVEEALSTQTAVVSRVPPSWVAARHVLGQTGSVHDGSSGDTPAVDDRRRPWALRSDIHAKFKDYVEEGRNALQGGGQQHPASLFPSLGEEGIRDSMDGAIELRVFSGTVISHRDFVVLDVMWLARVLKPILDHRGVTKNKKGVSVFANKELNSGRLLAWALELEGSGILRKGFARFLWSLKEQVTVGVDDSEEMGPAKFEEILEEIGVTVPLPEPPSRTSVHGSAWKCCSMIPLSRAGAETRSSEDGDGMDLLVIMRLPLDADTKTRRNLLKARRAALSDMGGKSSLKAVFEFDHAGAPHGLPERVMALSHKIGVFAPGAKWRLGGLFLLHSNDTGDTSRMILEYDRKEKAFVIEVLGQSHLHVQAVQFVISALFHVARDFPGASWSGWMGCGMGHDGEKMYILATSGEKQNQEPGSWIIPRHFELGRASKQRNLCGKRGLHRLSCAVEPDRFGTVLDVKRLYSLQEADRSQNDMKQSRCREAFDYVFEPLFGKIAGVFAGFTVTLFVAATQIDDAKQVLRSVCYGLAALCLVVAGIAAFAFAKEKTAEGKRGQERANRANQRELGPMSSGDVGSAC